MSIEGEVLTSQFSWHNPGQVENDDENSTVKNEYIINQVQKETHLLHVREELKSDLSEIDSSPERWQCWTPLSRQMVITPLSKFPAMQPQRQE